MGTHRVNNQEGANGLVMTRGRELCRRRRRGVHRKEVEKKEQKRERGAKRESVWRDVSKPVLRQQQSSPLLPISLLHLSPPPS